MTAFVNTGWGIFKQGENEFKKILTFKDEEYDNLAKTIRHLQMELRDLDTNYRNKSEEFKLQINQLQNDDEKKIYIINSKEKQNYDHKNEINKLNSIIQDLNSDITTTFCCRLNSYVLGTRSERRNWSTEMTFTIMAKLFL